jgi:hypothetical protein
MVRLVYVTIDIVLEQVDKLKKQKPDLLLVLFVVLGLSIVITSYAAGLY